MSPMGTSPILRSRYWLSYFLANRWIRVRFQGRGKRFCSSPQRQDHVWGALGLLLNLGVQWPGCEAALPSSAEVKNARSYTSTSTYIFMAWCLIRVLFFFIISGVGLTGTAATSGLLYKPQMIDEGDCGAIGGTKIGSGNRSTGRRPAPAPLCPPQIPIEYC
jgi:hypothetical protein